MAAQLILPKADSKDFVDRPTKRPISEIRRDFNRLRKRLGIQNFSKALKNNKAQNNDIGFQTSFTVKANPLGSLITSAAAEIASVASKTKIEMLKRFIDDNFDMPGTDLVPHDPEDWRPHPAILEETDSYGNEITNQNVKDVAIGLNDVWKELSRVKVEKKGRDSTLLSLPYPFMVPGGRFREFYYWDTYFILEGLIRSKMYESAFNIVRNFAHIIDKLGYIPNGTREYYKFRSQPPFFPLMLVKIMGINEEMDQFVLTEGLKMALNEYEWFRRYRSVHVKKGNKLYLLNFFHVKTDFPRPESLSEDIKTFLSQNVQSEGEIFSNLKSGAESGWDFSSRWFKGEGIETISAYNQIPVDLNAILFKNEQIISKLLEKVGDLEKAREFGDLSIRRHEAINEVLWNDNIGTWNDVRLDDHTFVDQRFFFSNVFPLIFDITPPSKTQESRKKLKKNDLLSDSPEDAQNIGRATENTIYTVLNAHKKELFSYKGGVPTSGEGPSEQQWDFPNVWAPHQYLIVEKLNSIGEKDMALQIARAFYNSVKAGFLQSKVFYEKYNCLKLGLTGKGGEYEAQTGFGWTNGTALSFIHMFGDLLDDDYDVQNEYEKISELLAAKVSGNEN
ncbi:Neutral trehalase [Pseudoloma neurophilia]|uniref:Trehalase n=1 Tax=Pseudoloma neurophilia TaxID=146866 RepID=A0A0R0LXG3_9MICR|nr:Neutral trehalase [Pseudoloma neurophilia]